MGAYYRNHYNDDGTPVTKDPFDNDAVSPLHTMYRVPSCPEFQQGRGDAGLKKFYEERPHMSWSRRTPEGRTSTIPEDAQLNLPPPQPALQGSLSRLPTGESTGSSQLRRLASAGSLEKRARSQCGSVRSGYTGLSGLSTASLRSEIRRQVQEELRKAFEPPKTDLAAKSSEGQQLTAMLLQKAGEARALQSQRPARTGK